MLYWLSSPKTFIHSIEKISYVPYVYTINFVAYCNSANFNLTRRTVPPPPLNLIFNKGQGGGAGREETKRSRRTLNSELTAKSDI